MDRQASALVHTSVADARSTIQCAVSGQRPLHPAVLRRALEIECESAKPRRQFISMVERELRRQRAAMT